MQFSVVIPAKNEERHIGRCLDSLAALDWDPAQYEIVVVDNGSCDATVAIAREMGAIVLEAPGATIASLRNLGAARGSGELIAFLDADCAVTVPWLKAASRYLAADGPVAFGSPVLVPDGGTWVQTAWFKVRGKPNQVVPVEWLESANLFVRRSAFEKVGGFDERLVTCEDYDLTTRLREVGELLCDARVAALHFREPATIAEFFKKERWRGLSNYRELGRRRVTLRELPSLLLPLGALAVSIALPVLWGLYALGGETRVLWASLALLLVWELPLGAVALRRCGTGEWLTGIRLWVLLNVYFFARGTTLVARG
ncbi:hypothetical protein GMLC_01410 [Geomonas limicola]|uniref:Glycosyltransferase 2-like domain-containing protein n=1 Tax=Geomonas limicola TaxID=2740186 RepID=A0A6V8N253_9BACT|nr:glycosyltransferase [Geomonas limicola]GFO66562.1 hypothetical protein GMLC_01410 [Geomonas limicola]